MIKSRAIIAVLEAIALVGLLSACDSNTAGITSTSGHDEVRKPNIVYVLTDQWRAQATGYSGDPNLIGMTPNLDHIANSGINFKNAISTTLVCTPHRAALLHALSCKSAHTFDPVSAPIPRVSYWFSV